MRIFINILGGISIVIGVIAVFGGMASSTEIATTNSMSIVIGGGLFMGLGVISFIFNKYD